MSNLNLKGYISNIQKFSVNDGQGIRTTVFLSGCPLRCKWCSNPETWQMNPKVTFFKGKCIKCKRCSEVCPVNAINKKDFSVDQKLCISCGKCVEECPTGAKTISGEYMSIKEVLDQIKKDIIFFRESGGGVTFSGGEPTYQNLFLKEIVDSLYDLGINMAIETCGYFDWKDTADIFSKMDLIFVDIKHMDSDTHKKLTGVKNELILNNIKKIGLLEKDIVIRTPIIKGVNDSFENIIKTGKFVKTNVPNGKIELLSYHQYGVDKYTTLGIAYNQNYERPSEEKMRELNMLVSREKVKLVDYK